MPNFIRSLCLTISTAFFHFIPKLYQLFYDLAANHNLFSEETIDTFSRNIYVLVSVVMLFAFAVKAIESIINPDMLLDSKKGYVSVIKRSAIALLLIVGIPFAFDLFYKVQDEIMAKSLIEKVIIGVSVNNNGTGDENLVEKSGAGNMLASTALKAVLYPAGEDTCVQYEDSDVCSNYNATMDDIDKMGRLIPDINEKVEGEDGEEDYVLTYEGYGIISILVGAVILYMLVLFCIDTALRLVKMGFLEITAPISVIAYIFGGNDILKNWFKEVRATAFSLFGRVAALALMIFVLSKLPEFVDNNFSGIYGKIISIFIIIAVLMFVKEAPNYIEKIFGVKVGGKGGISGRIGNMAGVGNIAKSAWDKVKTAGALGATAVAAGVGAGVGAIAKGIDNNVLSGRGQALAEKMRNKVGNVTSSISNSDIGQMAGRVKRTAAAGMKAGGTIGAVKSARQAYKEDSLTKYNEAAKQNAKDEQFMDELGIDIASNQLRNPNNSPTNARRAYSNYQNSLTGNKLFNDAQKRSIANKTNADLNKGNLERYQSSHNDVDEMLKTIENNALTSGNKQLHDRINSLRSDFNSGKISSTDLALQMRNLQLQGKITPTESENIVSKLDSMKDLVDHDVPGGAVSSLVKNGKASSAAIAGAITSATSQVEYSQKLLDAELDKVSNEKIKHEMENYISAASVINSAYTREISKQGTETPPMQGPVPSSGGSNNSESGNGSGGSNNSENGNGSRGSNNSENGNNSGGSNNSGSGNNSQQDLSGFFAGLSKDIKDANDATNSILNDQLKTQQSSLDESKKQNSTLNNISTGVNNINNNVSQMNQNIRNFANQNDKNLKDISQKLDDNNNDNNE